MNLDYTLEMLSGVGVVKSNQLMKLGVKHGFTTRLGGKSEAPIDTLNFGFNRPEPRNVTEANYKALCNAYSLDCNKLILVSYVHGCNVLEVTRRDCGRGIKPDIPPLPDCDGIVTNDPEVVLFTLHADCSAFFVYDPVNHAIGLAHAGWRGTYGRINSALIDKMHELYGTQAENVYAMIGPHICGSCYEVSRDIARDFIKEFGDASTVTPHDDPNKAYLDIGRAAYLGFMEAGVSDDKISMIPCCTYENSDLFYSYRRDGRGKTGAMGAFLTLEGII